MPQINVGISYELIGELKTNRPRYEGLPLATVAELLGEKFDLEITGQNINTLKKDERLKLGWLGKQAGKSPVTNTVIYENLLFLARIVTRLESRSNILTQAERDALIGLAKGEHI